MEKVLKIDYEKCTGCRLCELVCAGKPRRRFQSGPQPHPGGEMGIRRSVCPDDPASSARMRPA